MHIFDFVIKKQNHVQLFCWVKTRIRLSIDCCHRKALFGEYVQQVWRTIHSQYANGSRVSHADGSSDVSGLRRVFGKKKKTNAKVCSDNADSEEDEDGDEEENDSDEDEAEDDGVRGQGLKNDCRSGGKTKTQSNADYLACYYGSHVSI